MPVTLTEMRTNNEQALTVLEQSLNRLRQMRIGATITLRNRLSREINVTGNEITRLQIIDAHLRAAQTVVQPMSDEDTQELNRLAGILDAAIENDAIVNASLEFVVDLFDAAHNLSDIIEGNT